jgi:hypothetical protein
MLFIMFISGPFTFMSSGVFYLMVFWLSEFCEWSEKDSTIYNVYSIGIKLKEIFLIVKTLIFS